jgi:hypothetical protein
MKQQGERKKREKCWLEKKQGSKLIFGPDFLHAQSMKSTLIYRRWKRVIFSTQGKTFNP